MAKIKAIPIPLSERPHLIGDAELMGYLGIDTKATLDKYFLDREDKRNLRPSSQLSRKLKYYLKKDVDKYIQKMSIIPEIKQKKGEQL